MSEETVRTSVADGVAEVVIQKPEVLNALDLQVLEALGEAFDGLSRDASVRAVILTGVGKAFVAGADIRPMAAFTPLQAMEFSLKGQGVFDQIDTCPVPVIAAVNGYALGGGCELALACDIRIASETAKFGQPEVGLGVTPGFGGTQRLPRIINPGTAMQLLTTGETITAETALRVGLVSEVVPPDRLMPRCREIAMAVSRGGPVAVRLVKKAVKTGEGLTLDRALRVEAGLFAMAFSTRDQKEGMGTFLEKRKPQFVGD